MIVILTKYVFLRLTKPNKSNSRVRKRRSQTKFSIVSVFNTGEEKDYLISSVVSVRSDCRSYCGCSQHMQGTSLRHETPLVAGGLIHVVTLIGYILLLSKCTYVWIYENEAKGWISRTKRAFFLSKGDEIKN